MHALSADTVVTMIIFDYDIIKPFTEKIALASHSANVGLMLFSFMEVILSFII